MGEWQADGGIMVGPTRARRCKVLARARGQAADQGMIPP